MISYQITRSFKHNIRSWFSKERFDHLTPARDLHTWLYTHIVPA